MNGSDVDDESKLIDPPSIPCLNDRTTSLVRSMLFAKGIGLELVSLSNPRRSCRFSFVCEYKRIGQGIENILFSIITLGGHASWFNHSVILDVPIRIVISSMKHPLWERETFYLPIPPMSAVLPRFQITSIWGHSLGALESHNSHVDAGVVIVIIRPVREISTFVMR